MSTIKPLTILLAEDNSDHAELIIETLKDFNLGNKIHHVENGEKALVYLNNEAPYEDQSYASPDLILMDQKMPMLDGLGTLKEIRRQDKFKHIPVIMISTSTVDAEIAQCFEAGANSYITKPLSFEDFSKKIRDLNLYWVLTSEIPSNEASPGPK